MPRIIDVVDHVNVMDDELCYREPQGGGGDFRMGSQVIVQESQAAVFVRQGRDDGCPGRGSHTLSTANLPLLSSVIGFVTSGRNPFTVDLYFVNQKDMPQVPWGTNPPIVLETPGKGVGVVLLITHGVIDIGVERCDAVCQAVRCWESDHAVRRRAGSHPVDAVGRAGDAAVEVRRARASWMRMRCYQTWKARRWRS